MLDFTPQRPFTNWVAWMKLEPWTMVSWPLPFQREVITLNTPRSPGPPDTATPVGLSICTERTVAFRGSPAPRRSCTALARWPRTAGVSARPDGVSTGRFTSNGWVKLRSPIGWAPWVPVGSDG